MQRATKYSWDGIIIGIAFLLANLRALIFIFLFPDTSKLLGPAWIEILLWLVVSIAAVFVLRRENEFGEYVLLWKWKWLLGLFLLLAFVSISWSMSLVATLFRSLELLFATLLAAYVGMRFSSERLLDALFWFGAILFIFSIALVFGAPRTGTMYWAPFNGAWRGVYWHRNHLASIAALLSAVYFIRAWTGFQARNNKAVLDVVLYLLSLVILIFAKSATGYILFIAVHGFLVGAFVWLRISHRLQRKHYLFILGAIALAAILILTNLDFVFGLFNRDPTMTGRVGLWGHLLEIAFERLWLGHGFGAAWTLDAFRERIRGLVGWASQPLIGDNGFLDIFLHLGFVGLALFVGVLITATIRSVRYASAHKTLLSFFPLLIIFYAFFANIAFSLFAETEVFVWFLIITALFLTTSTSSSRFS